MIDVSYSNRVARAFTELLGRLVLFCFEAIELAGVENFAFVQQDSVGLSVVEIVFASQLKALGVGAEQCLCCG